MSKEVTTLKFKDKDGDDATGTSVFNFDVTVAHNGFVLTTTYDDDTAITEVFTDFDDVIAAMKEYF